MDFIDRLARPSRKAALSGRSMRRAGHENMPLLRTKKRGHPLQESRKSWKPGESKPTWPVLQTRLGLFSTVTPFARRARHKI